MLPQDACRNVREDGLDVLKCVAAFMVVSIHYGPSFRGHEVCDVLARVAVPCFLLITGYYYPLLRERGRLGRHVAKLAWLTLWATLLYFGVGLTQAAVQGRVDEWFGSWLTLRQMGVWIVLNAMPLAAPLWYLYAVLYALVAVWWMDRAGGRRAMAWALPVLLAAGYVVSVTLRPVSYSRNFLFVCIPYILLGRALREGRCGWLRRPGLGGLAALCGVASLLEVADAVVGHRVFGIRLRDFYLTTPLAAVTLFLFFLRCPAPRGGVGGWLWRGAARVGRDYATSVFVLHCAVGMALQKLWAPHAELFRPWRTLLVFALTLLVAAAWVWARRRWQSRAGRG